MTTDHRGLYLHVPFCKSKCAYCDFVSFAGALEAYEEKYVEALISEIYEYESKEKIKIDTVFVGGGTPSVISARSFVRIADAIRNVFDLSSCSEFTVEANPKTVTAEKLSAYTRCGVNRISLGLQTIHENELKILGRIHTFQDFLDSYSLCLNAGIRNVNVDLMYAIPEQTVATFTETLKRIIDLSPTHISAYGLILEPGTRLEKEKAARASSVTLSHHASHPLLS